MQMQAIFASLADPTRFRIVELLRKGEQPVSDLVRQAGIHQSGVSRHLGILLELGLVQVRRDGQHRRYSLKPEPFREIETWVAQYRSLWDARLDRLGLALSQGAASQSRQIKPGDTR